MCKKVIPQIIVVSVLIFVSCLSSIYAQSPEQAIVIYPAVEPQADSLKLSVFFSIVDRSGRPVSKPNIESASIQLINPEQQAVAANLEDPQTPFYITLLLDASGSMFNVINDVRTAAKGAIDNAPPTAHFSLIQFNDEIRSIADFTPNHNTIKQAIDQVDSVNNRGTCLYDAVYQALEMLDQRVQQPQERRAVLLFTDGIDQQSPPNTNQPCSQQRFDAVITRAKATNDIRKRTPIHTIGLFNQPGSINENELRAMASETVAFSAIGDSSNLRGMFQEIMSGLSNQWVAHANVFAQQGVNEAELQINLSSIGTPLTTRFLFSSSTQYQAACQPVHLYLQPPQYDKEQNQYFLSLSAECSDAIERLILTVVDDGGRLISAECANTASQGNCTIVNPQATEQVQLFADAFEAEREYTVQVKAVDAKGFLLLREDERIGGNDERTILAQRTFKHSPQQAVVVNYQIKTVNTSFANNNLFIDLDVPNTDELLYEGFIRDESGQQVANLERNLLQGAQIQMALPGAMRNILAETDYEIVLTLGLAGEVLNSEQLFPFKVTPPPPLTFWQRLFIQLQSPILLSIIIFIISCVITYLFYQRWQREKAKQSEEFPRPPVNLGTEYIQTPMYKGQTEVAQEDWNGFMPTPIKPKLHVQVIETRNEAQYQKKLVSDFPFTIGRDGCHMNILDDSQISRKHVKIGHQDGQFFLKDLDSLNHTYLGDKKLEPNKAIQIKQKMVIGLGRYTKIALEPMG